MTVYYFHISSVLCLVICLCCLSSQFATSVVSPENELHLLMQSLTEGKLPTTLPQTKELVNKSLPVIRNMIFPTDTSTSTVWYNAITYSDSSCSTSNAVTFNSYISGICINYDYQDTTKSVKFSCLSGSYANAQFYAGYDCVTESTATSVAADTCTSYTPDSTTLKGQKTIKYVCSVGADTPWYTNNQVQWFVTSGYTDTSCSNRAENVGYRNNYCFQESTSLSYKYTYPQLFTYTKSSSCTSKTTAEKVTRTFATDCMANSDTTRAYSAYTAVRTVAVKKDNAIQYTVKQVLSGLTPGVYKASRASIETVLAKVVASLLPGTTNNNIDFLRYTDPYSPSGSLQVEYQVSLPSVKGVGYLSAADAYNRTRSALLLSVRSGLFTARIALYASLSSETTLNGVQATVTPTVSGFTTGNTKASKDSIPTGMIAGIVVAVVVIVGMVVVWYRWRGCGICGGICGSGKQHGAGTIVPITIEFPDHFGSSTGMSHQQPQAEEAELGYFPSVLKSQPCATARSTRAGSYFALLQQSPPRTSSRSQHTAASSSSHSSPSPGHSLSHSLSHSYHSYSHSQGRQLAVQQPFGQGQCTVML